MLVWLGYHLVDHLATLLGCTVKREPGWEMSHYIHPTSVARFAGMTGTSGVLTPRKEVGQECAGHGCLADHVHGVFCVRDVLHRLSA